MIRGFLNPTGCYYHSTEKEFSSDSVKLCEKFSHELNFDRRQHFAETVLICNGWISIHESFILMGESDFNGKPLLISDDQMKWFERNKSNLNPAQLRDFAELSSSFYKTPLSEKIQSASVRSEASQFPDKMISKEPEAFR